jgi:hypothetical protein
MTCHAAAAVDVMSRRCRSWNARRLACACPCCHGPWGKMFEADFPDLIITRGGVRVVTQAAFDEMLRRLEAEIAQLERDIAD